MAAPVEKAAIDPFEHVVDDNVIHIFETIHWEIPLPAPFTKFVVFLIVSGILVGWMMLYLGRKMQSGEPPRGKLQNFAESLLFFVRDKIATPGIGEHDADKYLPFLTTTFIQRGVE